MSWYFTPVSKNQGSPEGRVLSIEEEKIKAIAAKLLATTGYPTIDAFEEAVKGKCSNTDPALVEAITLKLWCARPTLAFWECRAASV